MNFRRGLGRGVGLGWLALFCVLVIVLFAEGPVPAEAGTVFVTVEAGPFGTVTPAGICPVEEGQNASFSLSADAGCHVGALYVDCQAVDIGDSPLFFDYTVENVDRNHSLRAVFARDWGSFPEVRFSESGQGLGAYPSRGVALGDVDGDGDLDAFVTHDLFPNRVWFNGGTGRFFEGVQAIGVPSENSRGVALGDLDDDGDLDAFVTNLGQPNRVFFNDGDGVFLDSGQSLGSARSLAVSLGDLDGDGDLDAFVANYGEGNRVWLNDGRGSFWDSGQALGNSNSDGVSLGDLDGDGDRDAFVANSGQGNRVWLNEGGGVYSGSAPDPLAFTSRGVVLGDLDGDGDLDAFVANDSGGGNRVWLSDGTGKFADSGQSLGFANSKGLSLGDLDGDGDLDAFVINDGQGNRIWVNDGEGRFSDSGLVPGVWKSLGLALGDLDGDGDLDAFVANGQNGVTPQPDRVVFNRTGQYVLEFAVSGDQGGTLSGDVIQDVWRESSSLPVEALPDEGLCLAGWCDGEGNLWTANPLVLTDVSGDMTVEAVFDTATFTVSTGAGPGGTVSPCGDVEVTWSDDLPVAIGAEEGYRIDDVLVDGLSVGEVSTYTFTHVSADHHLLASFAPRTFTVTCTAGTGGSVTPSGESSVSWDGGLTVAVEADEGYDITDVKVDGLSVGAVSGYSFAGVREGHTLEATFKPRDVTVDSADWALNPGDALADALNAVSDGGTVRLPEGLSGTFVDLGVELDLDRDVNLVGPSGGLTLSGGGGHRVVHVEEGAAVSLEGFTLCEGGSSPDYGGGVLNEGTLTVTNCTVAGNGAPRGGGFCNRGTLDLSLTTVSCNSEGIYNEGGTVRLKSCLVAVNEGGDLNSEGGTLISSGFNLVGTGDTGSFAAPGDTVAPDIAAGDLFVGPPGAWGNGTWVLALRTGSPALDAGASSDLDGDVVSRDERGVSRPQGSGWDRGACEAEWYRVVLSCDRGGAISAEPYGTVEGAAHFTAFDSPSFVIVPEESMDLTGLSLDGRPCSLDARGSILTLEPLSSDHVVEAVFGVKTFSFTGTVSGDHGAVTPSAVSVDWGEDLDVTVSADAHCHIDRISVDGLPLEIPGGLALWTHTFGEVSGDHSVTAAFATDRQVLAVKSAGSGTGSVSPPGGTYDYGTQVTLTARPDVSSVFVGWTGDISTAENPAAVLMDADRTVTANFALKSFIVTSGAGAGGRVTPAGETTVGWGEGLTFVMTPCSGYVLSDVIVDGVSAGSLSTFSFQDVREGHTLRALFALDGQLLESGGVAGLFFPDGSGILDLLDPGGASLDLPGDLRPTVSADLGGLVVEPVFSADIAGSVGAGEMAGGFVGGVSFDIEASLDLEAESIDVLPLDLVMVLSEDRLSATCRESIGEDEPDAGLCAAFLSHVSIFKVVGGEAFDLCELILDAGGDPEDFFSLSRDGRGNFLVGLRLLVADEEAAGVAAVQAVPLGGEGRFLVFDGRRDGHFRDPIVAVEKESPRRDDGDWGCSLMGPLPLLGLLILPLLFALFGALFGVSS